MHDRLVNHLVLKGPPSEELREAWFADDDPVVASAGWALTSDRVVKKPEGIDQSALLDLVGARMKDAPERLQWAMNTCLAQIGITNCASPFAPLWIDEMVRRGSTG